MPPRLLAAALLLAGPTAATAQSAPPPAPAATPARDTPPRLIVAISVDQFSADLFAQYRQHFTRGFARLLTGAVFPSAYQSHAATETCPGHSTILTGMRPAHTGIIANTWIDQRVARADKAVYCVEDETVAGSDHSHYTVSDRHLRVPTLGELMKARDPRSRVVSVAGKDRAAVMMGGHRVDEMWWWDGKTFASYPGRVEPAAVTNARREVAATIARAQPALPLPVSCRPLDRAVTAGRITVGQGRFARAAGDTIGFRYSPGSDAAVFALAAALVRDLKLGRGPATDLLAVGASATDYIAHANGTQGAEMCIQMDELDRSLGTFLAALDRTGVDYEVMLTADHGSHDMTERQQQHAMPMETHAATSLKANAMGAAIGEALGIAAPVLVSAESKSGLDPDIYLAAALTPAQRTRVIAEALRRYPAQPQVQAIFTADQVAATPMPTTPPETWTLLERARASYDAQRSGDLILVTRPRVSGVVTPVATYVETHGSFWDYDRRVPLLFWRRGMTGFEQPLSVETVDIMPTLAATIGLPVFGVDGRCLDLDVGANDPCPIVVSEMPGSGRR